MISGFPPTFVATTGTPAAMDSRITLDRLSEDEGSTVTFNDASTAGISCRSPRKRIRSPSPSSTAKACSSGRRGPSPTKTNSTASNLAASRAAMRRNIRWFFAESFMRAIMPTRTTPGISGSAGVAPAKASSGSAFGITTNLRSGTPASRKHRAAARELQSTRSHS